MTSRWAKSFLACSLMTAGPVVMAEEITEKDRFWDTKLERHVYVCSKEGEVLSVGESCGKYWEKFPRKRTDLIKQIDTYKDLKRYDPVMIAVKKKGEAKWVLADVQWMYEDGSISTSERYTNPGPTPGSMGRTFNYQYITRQDPTSPFAGMKEVCAKEDFEVLYGPGHDKVYKIEKGEKLDVKAVFSNGYMSVSFQGFMKNFFSYGMDNKLPVPQNKVEACADETIFIHDAPRALKPVSDDGAGSPHSSGSKTKDK